MVAHIPKRHTAKTEDVKGVLKPFLIYEVISDKNEVASRFKIDEYDDKSISNSSKVSATSSGIKSSNALRPLSL